MVTPMQSKTYTIELTAEDVAQLYSFYRMSWGPQDCEITDHPSPLEATITKLWNEIKAELNGKICKNCTHYEEYAGCLCNKHGMRLNPTTKACTSYSSPPCDP